MKNIIIAAAMTLSLLFGTVSVASDNTATVSEFNQCDSGMYYDAMHNGDGFLLLVQEDKNVVIYFTNIDDLPFWGIMETSDIVAWNRLKGTSATPALYPQFDSVEYDTDIYLQMYKSSTGVYATVKHRWFTVYNLTKIVDFSKCQ